MNVGLLWWEYNELLEHLISRPDIWTESEGQPGLWLRSSSEGDGCGVLLVPPVKTGPYRQYVLRSVPMTWDAQRTDDYIHELLTHWTSYNYRLDLTTLFTEELHLDQRTASNVAIAAVRLGQGPEFDPDHLPEPTQSNLVDGDTGFTHTAGLNEPLRRVFYLTGGGYVCFRPSGGLLTVDISVKVREGFTGAGQFSGHVRPRNGDLRGAFTILFGEPLTQLTRTEPE